MSVGTEAGAYRSIKPELDSYPGEVYSIVQVPVKHKSEDEDADDSGGNHSGMIPRSGFFRNKKVRSGTKHSLTWGNMPAGSLPSETE